MRFIFIGYIGIELLNLPFPGISVRRSEKQNKKGDCRRNGSSDETDQPQSLLPALIVDLLSQIIEGHIRH